MNLFYSLPKNILQKINFLQQDYVGFAINIDVFGIFLVSMLFAIFIVFLSYAFGKKISAPISNKSKNDYDYLFFTAIGYIAMSSGIAILGLLSLFNFIFITLFLFFIIVYSFLPFNLLKNDLTIFFDNIKNDFMYLYKNKFVFTWTVLFILVALLNLINPEIREDQYHTDLPVMYAQKHTIMIPPYEKISVSASPLLSEMYYTPGILYVSRESARYIHFIYYILVLLTLINFSKLRKYKFAIYTPLLFATAPVVIHETSSMYVDFQWIFCFLLAFIMLLDLKNNKFPFVKSGLLFGGMLATKLWTIVFLIPFVLFLFVIQKNNKKRIRDMTIFIISALLVSGIWFLRAYILTRNPLYPAFSNLTSSNSTLLTSLSFFVGINYQLLNVFSFINVFSPLFFISLIFLIYKFKTNIKIIFKLKLFWFLFILFILYLLIHYPFGRYLLGLYAVFIFLSSFAVHAVYNKFKSIRILLNCILILLFSYYSLSSILVLPYALGISDKNKYLSRILTRDNSSYYDFDHKFSKYISPSDNVAMYNFHGYYYADFKYTDIQFIYDKSQRSVRLLKQKKYTKLLIRGGDIKWFCIKMNLTDCNTSSFSLISKYSEFPTYYLYKIN